MQYVLVRSTKKTFFFVENWTFLLKYFRTSQISNLFIKQILGCILEHTQERRTISVLNCSISCSYELLHRVQS